MRRVSLTARIGALSITIRSKRFEASLISRAKDGPLRSSAGFGARRPLVMTESFPAVEASVLAPLSWRMAVSSRPAETERTAVARSAVPTR